MFYRISSLNNQKIIKHLIYHSILILQVIRPLNSSLSDGSDRIRSKGKTSENNGFPAKKIAVIGAGFSGLTAAAELKRLGERKFQI